MIYEGVECPQAKKSITAENIYTDNKGKELIWVCMLNVNQHSATNVDDLTGSLPINYFIEK